MTLAVLDENSSEEGFRVPSPEDGDSEQDAIEEGSDDRRRYESDSMLAQAYRELSEASRDMATWSHATSVSCPVPRFSRNSTNPVDVCDVFQGFPKILESTALLYVYTS